MFQDYFVMYSDKNTINNIPDGIFGNTPGDGKPESEGLSSADMKRMLYLLSHDFREPLRMIHSFVQIIEKDYLSNIDANGKEYLSFIYNGVKRLRSMLDGLLLFYRISNKEVAITEISLNQLVDSIREALFLKYKDTKVIINRMPLPNIKGDYDLVKEIFFQVLENAIVHNMNTEITISIEYIRTENACYIGIKDNGKGIDEKQMERVFDILQSFDTENKGSGIGLSVAKKIMEKHGGAIEILSEKQRGTAIHLHFSTHSILSENE
jgi:two-component system, chemotaxis family, sensor kinase Cph1